MTCTPSESPPPPTAGPVVDGGAPHVFTYSFRTRVGVLFWAAFFIVCFVRQWGGWNTVLLASLGAAAVVATLSVLEVCLSRVLLGEQALELRSLVRRESHPRTTIVDVVAAPGGYLYLRLQDGQRRRLSTMGRDHVRMAQAIRRWAQL